MQNSPFKKINKNNHARQSSKTRDSCFKRYIYIYIYIYMIYMNCTNSRMKLVFGVAVIYKYIGSTLSKCQL